MQTDYLKGTDLNCWWEIKRWEYNKGLLISGAFSLVLAWFAISLEESSFMNIGLTIIVIVAFLIFYGVYMTVANVLYYLGHTADIAFNRNGDDDFRNIIFNCGYWFPTLILPLVILIYIGLLLNTVPQHTYQIPAQ